MSRTKRKRDDDARPAAESEEIPLETAASMLRAETDVMCKTNTGHEAIAAKAWPFFLRSDVCFAALWVRTIQKTDLVDVLPIELWTPISEYAFHSLDYNDEKSELPNEVRADILAIEYDLATSFQTHYQNERAIFHLRRFVGVADAMMHAAGFSYDNVATNLSKNYLEMGDNANALKWANEALIRDPQSIKGHYRQGYALVSLGHAEQAVVSLSTALTRITNADTIRNMTFHIAELKQKKGMTDYVGWSTKQVSDWVLTLGDGFSAIAQRFQSSGIDGTLLPTLDDSLLFKLGATDDVLRHVLLTKIKALC